MPNLQAMSDRYLARYYAYLDNALAAYNTMWDSMGEKRLKIERDLIDGQLSPKNARIQRHRLNILIDHLMVYKVELEGLNKMHGNVAAELDKRGYSRDERQGFTEGDDIHAT